MSEKSPDAYRTISEAGEETGLPAHVLRFWESRFTQLKPVKRAGGRRLYRPQDVQLLKGLKKLLYEEGFTIKGAQKYLKDHGVAQVCAMGLGAAPLDPGAVASDPVESPTLADTRSEPALLRDDADHHTDRAGGDRHGVDPAQLTAILDRLGAAKTKLDAALADHRAA